MISLCEIRVLFFHKLCGSKIIPQDGACRSPTQMPAILLVSVRHDVGVGSVSVAEKNHYSYVQISAGPEIAVGKKLVTTENKRNEF